jgi:hypothetical protein
MCVVRSVAASGAVVVLSAFAPTVIVPQQPPGYTFELDVAMAMRHFPWLHFHLKGEGLYQPGVSYIVHFTSVPWFIPKARHDVDLSMIDPLMWPRLHSLDDPGLLRATVALGPYGMARTTDATYSDGTHIETKLNCGSIDGFALPATMTAQIDEPHLALSANADFEDYAFNSEPQSRTMLE